MPSYKGKVDAKTQVKEYGRTKDGISKLRGSKEPAKLKIDERLWSIGVQDKTSQGIDPSLGKPKDQKLYKKYVKEKSLFHTDVYVNAEEHKERTIELD